MTAVEVSLEGKSAVIEHDTTVAVEQFIAAIEELGYDVEEA